VANARAREPTRKTALVSRHPYSGGTGPEQRLSATLDSGRKPLETSTGLGRNQPHGIRGVDQRVDRFGGPGYPDRVNARRHAASEPGVRGHHDLVTVDRRQILEQGAPHRKSFARERARHRPASQPTAGYEFKHEDAHEKGSGVISTQ
jgi:hypothetical protein